MSLETWVEFGPTEASNLPEDSENEPFWVKGVINDILHMSNLDILLMESLRYHFKIVVGNIKKVLGGKDRNLAKERF